MLRGRPQARKECTVGTAGTQTLRSLREARRSPTVAHACYF